MNYAREPFDRILVRSPIHGSRERERPGLGDHLRPRDEVHRVHAVGNHLDIAAAPSPDSGGVTLGHRGRALRCSKHPPFESLHPAGLECKHQAMGYSALRLSDSGQNLALDVVRSNDKWRITPLPILRIGSPLGMYERRPALAYSLWTKRWYAPSCGCSRNMDRMRRYSRPGEARSRSRSWLAHAMVLPRPTLRGRGYPPRAWRHPSRG